MNNTRVVIVLDQSKSMADLGNSPINYYNGFVSELKSQPGTCTIKLVTFNDTSKTVYDLPLAEAPLLTHETYTPNGNTALLETQSKTIEELGHELSSIPEQDRPNRVVVCTISDGLENASSAEFTTGKVRDQIELQRQKYNWEIMFLGSNQDAVQTAQAMGIPKRSSLTFDSTKAGLQRGLQAAAQYINSYRAVSDQTLAAQNMAFSDVDRQASVGQISYSTGINTQSGAWAGSGDSGQPTEQNQDGNVEPVPYASA